METKPIPKKGQLKPLDDQQLDALATLAPTDPDRAAARVLPTVRALVRAKPEGSS